MSFAFADPWHQFLPREGGHVVALAGSGGKTSLMRVLAGVLAAEGVKLVLTTTTRTEPLVDIPVLELSDLERQYADERSGLPHAFFLHAGTLSDGKWQGIEPGEVDRLGERHPDRIILVEVDGAAKHPVKLYREGEPCWPERTSLAMVVMGTAALDQPAAEALHRFGREEFFPLADLRPDTLWAWEHFEVLLTAPGGYVARVPDDVPAVLVMTGLGELNDSIGLFEFVGKAMAHPRLPLAVFAELAGQEPSLRTAFRETEDDES